MWINARTMDGKKSSQVSGISQKTKIEELRVMLEKEFGFPPARQRLFFSGKQVCNDNFCGIIYQLLGCY